MNQTQKKEVTRLVTKQIKKCKDNGRDPMFITDDVNNSILWAVNWRFEWYDYQNDKNIFTEYALSIMDDIIKKVYKQSPIDYVLSK